MIIIDILSSDKSVLNNIKKYGELSVFPFGMTSYYKYSNNSKYKFDKNSNNLDKVNRDYTGSYHLTITLPYKPSINKKDFIEMHEHFANQIQWLEPLLLCSFFSSDDKAVGTSKTYARGSYRIMNIGWGNLAGSDIRRFNKGIGRYANIKSYWREGLEFEGINKLKPCYNPSASAVKEGECRKLIQEYCKKSKSFSESACKKFIDDNKSLNISDDLVEYCIKTSEDKICTICSSSLSSDIRTFGDRKILGDKIASGAPMDVSRGIEIRIFDNFSSDYLIELCRIIVYIAANSQITKTTKYVYKNKEWINAVQSIMKLGWKALLSINFIKLLRKELGLKIKISKDNIDDLIAFNVFQKIINELYEKTKNHDFVKLMLQKYETSVQLPKLNKHSWEFSFLIKLNRNTLLKKKFKDFLKELDKYNTISCETYIKIYHKFFSKKNWLNNLEDILFFMKSNAFIDFNNFLPVQYPNSIKNNSIEIHNVYINLFLNDYDVNINSIIVNYWTYKKVMAYYEYIFENFLNKEGTNKDLYNYISEIVLRDKTI